METISCWLARTIICAKHYSKRIVNNSYLHLGIFSGRELVDVIPWAFVTPMVPAWRVASAEKFNS